MIGLEFTKMSGHGNDFILVDNWDGQIGRADMPGLTRAVCRRQLGVGADGMVFIEAGPDEVDFAWEFFNSDGSEAEMCGNAGRCAARFAYLNGIAPAEMQFMTRAGIIRAEVGPKTVKNPVDAARPGGTELYPGPGRRFARVLRHEHGRAPCRDLGRGHRGGRGARDGAGDPISSPFPSPPAPTPISCRSWPGTGWRCGRTSGGSRTRPWPAAPARWPRCCWPRCRDRSTRRPGSGPGAGEELIVHIRAARGRI